MSETLIVNEISTKFSMGVTFFIIQESVLPTERYLNLSQAMKISVKMVTHGRFIYMRLYEMEHMYTM